MSTGKLLQGSGDMNRTTERTMAILQLIGRNEQGLTLQEIATQMDMAKSSASVIVHTLLELNYIKTMENNDKKFCLGVETFTLGMKYLNELNLVRTCANYLPALAEKYARTAFVAVLNGTNIVYVYKYAAQNARLATCSIGSTKEAYATALGKAIIAFLPEEERTSLISKIDFRPFTKYTIATPEQFTREMDLTNVRGYARERGELEEITLCYAAPIFDYSGRVVAAVSLSDLYSEDRVSEEPALVEDMLAASREISRVLGFTPRY